MNKKIIPSMEKNFIKREDLNQIVGELVERMLDHTAEIRLEINIGKDYRGNDEMRVITSNSHYQHLDTLEYQIIESVSDWMEVTDEVIGRAVELAQAKEKEEEARAKAEAEAAEAAEAAAKKTEEQLNTK